MRFEEKIVTPEMATQMLGNMVTNRNIRPQRLKRLEQNLKDGTFTSSPNPVSVSANGVLLDGQHRLNAIKNTGIPARLVIAYDVPTDSVIDRGAERSEGDSIYMRGLVSNSELCKKRPVALMNRYFRIARPGDFSAGTITDDDKAKFLNENGPLMLEALSLCNAGSSSALANNAAAHTPCFAALKCGVSVDSLRNFFSVVNSGFCIDGIGESAASLVRNYLDPKGFNCRNTTEADHMVAVIEMAIHDYVKKQPRRRPYQKLCHYYIDKIEGKTCLAGISGSSNKVKKSDTDDSTDQS